MKEDYVFPFEGEKHLGTVIMLPYREDTWRNKAKPALKEFHRIIREISRFEKVLVIADPSHFSDEFLLDYTKDLNLNVNLLRLPYDDSWARDPLPVFLRDKEGNLLGNDYGFNSWGGSYDGLYYPYDEDNSINQSLLPYLGIPREAFKDFILEGGSIHTDGEGTLLVTEECLLSKGRNPSLSKEQIEEKLKETLNVKKVLWLPHGIYNDETDGHVDNIACFLAPGTVLLAVSENKEDPQYLRSQEDLDYLSSVTDAKGRKLRIITVPVPDPALYLSAEEEKGIKKSQDAVERKAGRRLAASYVNFYLGENFLVLPSFGVKEDKTAYKILHDFYQDQKEIIQVPSKEILLGGGNIHCITKQIPYSDKYHI